MRMVNASTVFRELAGLIDANYKLARLSDPGYAELMQLVRLARWYARERLGHEIAPGFDDELIHNPFDCKGRNR